MTDEGRGDPPAGDPGDSEPPAPFPTGPVSGPQPYPQQPLNPTRPLPQLPDPHQPQYPSPGYGPVDSNPGGGYPPGYGAAGAATGPGQPGGFDTAGTGTRRTGLLAAIGAAVLVVALVVAYFALSSGSGASASTPKDAVKKLLEARRSSNLNQATKFLCQRDIALGEAGKLDSAGRVVSYSVGPTSRKNGLTTVEATVTTTQSSRPGTQAIPVVKEGGSWKVCFSQGSARLPASAPSSGGATSSAPSATSSGASGGPSLPIGLNICAASTDRRSTAEAYVGAAEVGLSSFAQSCVYHNSVPPSVTASLSGTLYVPQTSDSGAGRFVFTSPDGRSTVTIEVTKESDGHFYVTGLQKS
jgi:hypothetical protein